LAVAGARETESAVIMNQLANHEGITLIPGVDQGFRYQLPRLGKLRLGIKVPTTSGGERPKATEYIVLPPELLESEKFMDVLAAYNDDPSKPTRIPIQLACGAIGGNMRRSCDLYGSSKGLLCRTYDAITCERVDQQTGEWTSMPCAQHNACKDFEKKACHWIHRLRVVVPDAPGIGVWQIDTTSPNNWATLLSEMGAIKNQLGGKLAGVDLFLTLEPREFQITMEDKRTHEKKLQNTTAWLLHIRSEMSMRELREAAKDAISYDATEVEDFDENYDEMVDLTGADDFEVGEAEVSPIEPEVASELEALESATEELRDRVRNLLDALFTTDVLRRTFSRQYLGETTVDDANHDQLLVLVEALEARAKHI